MTRLWTGKLPLEQALWRYAVVYGLLVNGLLSLATFALFASDASPVFGLAAYVAPVPYNVAVVVGVWRSADRYAGSPGRAELARWAAFAWMILLSVL